MVCTKVAKITASYKTAWEVAVLRRPKMVAWTNIWDGSNDRYGRRQVWLLLPRYSGVPHRVHVRSVIRLANPKSVILRWPSRSSSRFSGFKSRYTTGGVGGGDVTPANQSVKGTVSRDFLLLVYSAAGGKLIHEKNQKQKISWLSL